jgi:hypothetical protein
MRQSQPVQPIVMGRQLRYLIAGKTRTIKSVKPIRSTVYATPSVILTIPSSIYLNYPMSIDRALSLTTLIQIHVPALLHLLPMIRGAHTVQNIIKAHMEQ